MGYLLRALTFLLFCYPILLNAQSLQPFSGCPGISVAITRAGFNAAPGPYQIYVIDSAGGIQPSGNPIDLRINGFGLNNADGFLYGIHSSSNVIDPLLGRVDKNGNFENVGRLTGPPTNHSHIGIINTAAGTCDGKDNYYFLAITVNLQDLLAPPVLYVGKVSHLSLLQQGDRRLDIQYTPINPGTFLNTLLETSGNPLTGVFQDIAYNGSNGYIYTYYRAPGTSPTPGIIAYFNPADSPTFISRTPATDNIATNDLSGLYFGTNDSLYILTTDGNLYKGSIYTGRVTPVAQTALPLMHNNLRGDMASCVGKKPLVPFTDCPGVSVAITRVGNDSKHYPFRLYTIDTVGNVSASGNLIPLQINGFGLNAQDGFLYALHETGNVHNPWFAKVDRFGSFVNIGLLAPPPASGSNLSVINTTAGTMDGSDNFYFLAAITDTSLGSPSIPHIYLGTISNVSRLQEGDSIPITYKEVSIGSGVLDILNSLGDSAVGHLQDISFNPIDHQIYTTLPTTAAVASPAQIGHFDPSAAHPVLNVITPTTTNPPIANMCGMFSGAAGDLFILTTDGRFYKGDPGTGEISLITRTALPVLGNDLRGDMASCVPRSTTANVQSGVSNDADPNGGLHIAPNPVASGQITVSVNSQGNDQARLQIIGPTGSPLKTRNIQLIPGSNQFQLDVSQLNQGVYSVILYCTSGRVSTIKFVRL